MNRNSKYSDRMERHSILVKIRVKGSNQPYAEYETSQSTSGRLILVAYPLSCCLLLCLI